MTAQFAFVQQWSATAGHAMILTQQLPGLAVNCGRIRKISRVIE